MSAGGEMTGEGAGRWWGSVAGREFRREGGVLRERIGWWCGGNGVRGVFLR
jgi:hypothetical protein